MICLQNTHNSLEKNHIPPQLREFPYLYAITLFTRNFTKREYRENKVLENAILMHVYLISYP